MSALSAAQERALTSAQRPPMSARAAAARACTCGGADYPSCLCDLTPREWIEHAQTNPQVDPSVALPKGRV